MAIQIGKYKRNGIFIEEIDKSIFTTPVSNGITNLVIGVSKKGPVNTPIRLTSVGDLEAVFGQLDRNLERKGSFFHRTVSKMLETSPVYAMNLLATDDNLDKIEYKSLSTSAGYINSTKREESYRRFFDTTGFWKRDTESFINLTKNDDGYTERLLNLTNLSDRHITTFVVKTAVSGFDRTMLEWYGSVEKMPAYVSSTDFASDYMVDVIVVGGDWSNYQELASDTRWSQYFNKNGLIKGQLRSFANDRNVTLLGYYEGASLIPYFRDLNNRNIFIETLINRETDKTGLYCALNADLLEQDFYTGLVDLSGATLVGAEKTEIDFLSYKETIVEEVPFTSVPLDIPGNVVALFGSVSYISQDTHAFGFDNFDVNPIPHVLGDIVLNGDNRTAWFAEGSVFHVGTPSIVSTTSSITLTYNSKEDNAFAIISDKYLSVQEGIPSFSISANNFTYGATAVYTSTVVLSLDGNINLVNGTIVGQNPTVLASDIVLDFITYSVNNHSFATNSIHRGDDKEYVEYGYADPVYFSDSDYFIYDLGNGDIKVEFFGTNAVPSTKNYRQYRKFKTFNKIISILDSALKDRATLIIDNSGTKRSLENMTISNIVNSSTQNKSFILHTGDSAIAEYLNLTGQFTLYKVDNEFILGEEGAATKDEKASIGSGVIAKYSNFYSAFQNGNINTGDFFYDNRLMSNSGSDQLNAPNNIFGDINVTFHNGVGLTYSGYNYIVFETISMGATACSNELGLISGERLQFPESLYNKGEFTLVNNSVNANDSAMLLAIKLGFDSNFFAYEVNENIVNESVPNLTIIYNLEDKHYLKLFTDSVGNVELDFVDRTLSSLEDINVIVNNNIIIKSDLNNLKQTLEIEEPVGYTQVPNKILVIGSRYTEVKVGDFLESDWIEPGFDEGVARKFTRVLSKRQYVGNTLLSEITCDYAIKKINLNGDRQATRYVSIDQYANTYKAISLKGFRIRQASLPDGTEDRQNRLLNLVAKGTPLFKALTNKESFDFRYLIDSFGLGLTERSKQQLVDICGDRLNVFGFINMPSLKSFKNSSSPSFVNTEGVLQSEFIAKGGDPESNPAFLYSFGEGAGVTTVGYFLPYVTVNDNGRPMDFPPASYVATTYMRKHISNVSSITPWTIAAGVTNGRVTGIAGVEQEFDNSDIEFFTQAQMNPITLKRTRGYVIETESTALTLYKSALSSIHAREVLIELERELATMLLDYQWRFNTPDVRAEIKLRADVICETFVNKNGIYDYFNKMDEENNTGEIIDNQIGVLDTYIEVIRGMSIIVNNITILKTGAIASGGFLNA